MASFPDSAARIQFLADGSLHPFVLRLNPDNTISNVSVIDGAGIQGTWDPDLESVTFTLPVDGGVREYSGYLMRFLSDGSAALAGVARVTWDDGSHDDNTGWYAVEDLPHLRLEPPNQTDPPAPPNGRWRIADGGTIGTLYISTVEDGTLAVGSTLNARPINGSWDRFLSELSFVQSYGDPRDAQSSNFDGYLALTGGDGSLVLAGTVTYHDRQDQQIGGWFAVYKGRTAMAPIAETDYANPAFDVSNPLWPAQRVGTLQTYLSGSQPSFEWVPILNPVPMRGLNEVHGPEPQGGGLPGPGVGEAWTLPNRADNELDSSQDRIVGVSGLVLEAHESLEDMPFTHPFGKDYTFDLAPDERYWPLMAVGDIDMPALGAGWFSADEETRSAVQQANAWNGGNLAVPGVLHLEIDQGQLPQQYRPQDMERAVVFGRWIIDAGHPDFGSEIHPPLLIVRAQDLGVGDYTSSTVIARGYLVSQIFGWKTDLMRTPRGLYDSIVDQIKLQLQSQELTLLTQSGDPNAQVTADPVILPGYFGAEIVSMPFILRPGTGRKSSFDKLSVAYRLAGRSGVSVYLEPLDAEVDAVLVRVEMSNLPPPPDLPRDPMTIPVYGENSQLPKDVADRVKTAVAELAYGIRNAKGLEKYGLSDIQDQLDGLAQYSRDHFADEFLTIVNNGVLTSVVPESSWPPAIDVSGGPHPAGYETVGVDELKNSGAPVALDIGVDDSQPYPVAGRVDVYWSRA